MKTLVVFYSLTGATKKVARELARVLKADLHEIESTKSYEGFWGFFRGGRDSWRDHLAPVEAGGVSPGDYDLVVLGGPVWAGRAAPPLRRYIQDHKGEFKQVGLFLTEGGSPPKKAFDQLESMVGKRPVATMTVLNRTVAVNDFEADIADFAGPIRMKEEAVF